MTLKIIVKLCDISPKISEMFIKLLYLPELTVVMTSHFKDSC